MTGEATRRSKFTAPCPLLFGMAIPLWACSNAQPPAPQKLPEVNASSDTANPAGTNGTKTNAEAPDASLEGASAVISDAATSAEGVEPAEPQQFPRQLLFDGKPYLMLGVCWNPVPQGAIHPQGLDFAGFAAQDIALMGELGINTIRTYEPLLDRNVLDQLSTAGIAVINGVYQWGGDDPSAVISRIAAVKDHPAILMWSVGNEWNYNGLYVGLSHEESLARLNEVVELIRGEDSTHPIATIYGELPSEQTLAEMPGIDVWGINSYRGLSFGTLFDDWAARSTLPMFMAEYGADSYNAITDRYDPDSHAQAVSELTAEILNNASALVPSGITVGGTLFEWSDEWWKDSAGSPNVHDIGGIAPGGGPFPDATFNEEWWGLVELDRTRRPAFESLKAVFASAQAGR